MSNKGDKKMSKAEKMFNELGFRKDDLSKIKGYEEIIRYSKIKKTKKWHNEKLLMSVTFVKDNNQWEIYIYDYREKDKIIILRPKDLPLIKAITQQMKELGWLE